MYVSTVNDMFYVFIRFMWISSPGTSPIRSAAKFYEMCRYRCIRSSHVGPTSQSDAGFGVVELTYSKPHTKPTKEDIPEVLESYPAAAGSYAGSNISRNHVRLYG